MTESVGHTFMGVAETHVPQVYIRSSLKPSFRLLIWSRWTPHFQDLWNEASWSSHPCYGTMTLKLTASEVLGQLSPISWNSRCEESVLHDSRTFASTTS